jgi:hypothetical protein
MNDEKGFSASTSTVPASADVTPLERQILLPFTPPATNEWPIHRESQLADLRLEPLRFYHGHPEDVASLLRTIRRNNADYIRYGEEWGTECSSSVGAKATR